MKLAWQLMTKKDTLWGRMLKTKYRASESIIADVKPNCNMSQVWKAVCDVWKHVEKGF